MALLAAGLAATASAEVARRDDRFIIVAEALYTEARIDYLHDQLVHGLAVLESLGLRPDPALFPITVRAKGGRGVAHDGPQGDIVLHRLNHDRAPILHELTHLVAGYDRTAGHWSQEGFASYVQDKFGANPAYPTYAMAHALANLLAEKGELLPMEAVMADRGGARFFGVADMWSRWRAHVQSASFVAFLIERAGLDPFLVAYDRPVEAVPFEVLYGRSQATLIAEWREHIRARGEITPAARSAYGNARGSAGR